MDITVKESKAYSTTMFVFYSVFYCLMLSGEFFLIDKIIDFYNANQSINVSSLCIAIVAFVFVTLVFIFGILSTVHNRNATYTFTNDKIVKSYKQKVKWEIQLSDVQTVTISGWMLTVLYKKRTVTDKSQKVSITDENRTAFKNAISFQGYFKKDDLQKIKDKIIAYNTENGENIKMITN